MYNRVNNVLLVHPYARHQALPLYPRKARNTISSICRFFWKEFGAHYHRATKCMFCEDSSGFTLGERTRAGMGRDSYVEKWAKIWVLKDEWDLGRNLKSFLYQLIPEIFGRKCWDSSLGSYVLIVGVFGFDRPLLNDSPVFMKYGLSKPNWLCLHFC